MINLYVIYLFLIISVSLLFIGGKFWVTPKTNKGKWFRSLIIGISTFLILYFILVIQDMKNEINPQNLYTYIQPNINLLCFLFPFGLLTFFGSYIFFKQSEKIKSLKLPLKKGYEQNKNKKMK
jgi:glucan phosphoethanolaminetransferase (alkaline phosphatase superfamily)